MASKNDVVLTHFQGEDHTKFKYITEQELRTHNKIDDLWISIHGKIYDVTDWVNHHPGGTLVLLYFSGQDVTDPFLAYHPISSSNYLHKFFTGYHLKDYKVSEMSKDYRKMWSEFQKSDLFNQKGHCIFNMMSISMITFFLSIYGVLSCESLLVHLGCAALLGFSWIQFGWFMHDASHYQALTSRRINNLALFLVSNCMLGVSKGWWKRAHNTHHIYTNSLGYDPDTEWMPAVVRVGKFFNSLKIYYYYNSKIDFDSGIKFMLKNHVMLFFFLTAFGRPYAYVRSLIWMFSRKRLPRQELLGLVVFWVWYLLFLSYLPNWFERITFDCVALAVVGIQNFQFGLNHSYSDVYIGNPSGNEWFEKQIVGSLNISCSPWMDWFHGGLQFQIEHHLFPRMPRCHLRRISPLVKELCKKHNLPYSCATSFYEASLFTLHIVHDVALEARNTIYPTSKT